MNGDRNVTGTVLAGLVFTPGFAPRRVGGQLNTALDTLYLSRTNLSESTQN